MFRVRLAQGLVLFGLLAVLLGNDEGCLSSDRLADMRGRIHQLCGSWSQVQLDSCPRGKWCVNTKEVATQRPSCHQIFHDQEIMDQFYKHSCTYGGVVDDHHFIECGTARIPSVLLDIPIARLQ